MATRIRRKFTAEFTREAVKLAGQPGRSMAAVAKELGIERSVLKHWIDNFAAGRYEKDRTLPLKTVVQARAAKLEQFTLAQAIRIGFPTPAHLHSFVAAHTRHRGEL